MSKKDTHEFLKTPNLLEKMRAFGGSFVPAWFLRDVVYSLGLNELHRVVWKDLTAHLSQTGASGSASDPNWKPLTGNISAWSFPSNANKELVVSFHINHDIKPGSLMFPHIHFAPETTNTGVVRWGIEYTFAKGHGQEHFPASQTIYLEQAGAGVALMHQIAEAVEGQAITAPEVDSLVLMRIFRDASNVADTHAGGVFGLTVDFHYQADAVGTVNKSPNFYKEVWE